MSSEFDNLLAAFQSEGEPVDYADRVVKRIEDAYRGLPSAALERDEEESELKKKLQKLEVDLASVRNVKNAKLVKINARLAEKRKLIRKQIEDVKDRLYVLEKEKEGFWLRNDQIYFKVN